MASSSEIVAAFKALKATGRLRGVIQAEYRCRRGCHLGTVFAVPAGPMFYTPSYRLSPTRNDLTSVESARAKNTLDGNRTWKERGFDLTDLAEWEGSAAVDVQCNHVEPLRLDPRAVVSKLGRPGSPSRGVLPDGS